MAPGGRRVRHTHMQYYTGKDEKEREKHSHQTRLNKMQYGTRNMTSRLNIALDESQRKKKEKSHFSVYKITNMRVFFNLHSQATTKHDLDVSFFCQLYFGI